MRIPVLPIEKRGKTLSENSSRKRRKRNQKKAKPKSPVDISEDLDDALKKMNLKKWDLQLDLICLNRQIEKKKGKQPHKEDIVKELKYGRLERLFFFDGGPGGGAMGWWQWRSCGGGGSGDDILVFFSK
ncbi:hypothetical protein L1987_02244 [Smallanthus sonchifolius]|uniref:Uncharacterized protein n=1 Tax=Smallanthus sonchifolius TaxID=185202 RepID=A0ACB9K7B7_9ASTR|nr:hypothetical protein L1987_02244 [Smallanthus sonchifolius]